MAEFEIAIKAITAFTVLWRATRRGTGNIDSEYRMVMAGDSLTGIGPLARQRRGPGESKSDPQVDADALKGELAARLMHSEHGGIANLASFLALASALPLYKISQPLTRFLLLAAYCFARGSERWHRWLMTHRTLSPYIIAFREKRGLTREQKFRIAALITITLLVTGVFAPLWIGKALAAFIWVTSLTYLYFAPSAEKSE